MIIKGNVHKFGDFINTDIHCSSKYAGPDNTKQQIVDSIFSELKPGFARHVKPGDVIAAGESFGTVSTREEAPELLRTIGIKAVLAKSFGYLFFRNAINLGLPVIECDTDKIEDGDEITLDIENMSGWISRSGKNIAFKTVYSKHIYEILKDGGLTSHLKKYGGYFNVPEDV